MYNPALQATKHVTSYYGDISINPKRCYINHLTIIPRRDTLTGRWMFMERCVRVDHHAIAASGLTGLKSVTQIYYFSNESWLQVLLS